MYHVYTNTYTHTYIYIYIFFFGTPPIDLGFCRASCPETNSFHEFDSKILEIIGKTNSFHNFHGSGTVASEGLEASNHQKSWKILDLLIVSEALRL